MPRFTYQVRDGSGRLESGALTADSAQEAAAVLRRDGRLIVGIQEQIAGAGGGDYVAGQNKKVKHDDVIYFATQLAVMVDTGVPLSEALDAIAEQTEHPGMAVMVRDISNRVKGGEEFSSVLGSYPKVFDKLFVALMRASEASGTMGKMLERASQYMVQERDTRKKIKGAMTYPAFMLSFCVLVVVGLLIFVLPRFKNIYSSKGAALPLPTRMLMTVSEGIVDYWPIILGALVVGGFGGYSYFRSPKGQIMSARIRIRVPIIGSMFRKAYLARSLRTMATMVASGVSVLDGLEITGEAAGNYFYQKVWLDVAQGVQEGSTLSDRLFNTDIVPRTISQMISAGEKTGRLAMVMDRVAGFCEEDLAVAVKAMTQMIEPLMIIIMGLIIGGIAMALLLPIFSISKVMAQ